MQHRVVWIRRDVVVGGTPFPSLAAAKAHAEEHFPHQKTQGVDRYEVRDEDDKLCFSRPRVLHKG